MHLDARRAGVVVPPSLKSEAHLVLQYGHDLPIPIPDLEIDDYGVRATLSFSRTACQTVVPWSAVYVLASDDGRGVLYAEDVPPDVAVISAQAKGEADRISTEIPAEGGQAIDGLDDELMLPVPRVARLRSVPVDAVASPDTAADFPVGDSSVAEPLAARRRRRPQLRLVK